MKTRYKIVLSSKNIYKEIEFTDEVDQLTIGTASHCDMRIPKVGFFEPVELIICNTAGIWSVDGSDNLYFSTGNEQKLLTKRLAHGEIFHVKYSESNTEVFEVMFMVDFDYEEKNYSRAIEIHENQIIKIGGTADCHIYISDMYLGQDYIILECRNTECIIRENKARYGVYLNGSRCVGEVRVPNFTFFSLVGFSFYYKANVLYTTDHPALQVQGLGSYTMNMQSTRYTYPKFIRNTRIQYQLNEKEIDVLQPKAKIQKPKKNLLMSLIPAVTMLALVILLRGVLGGGSLFVVYSACSMSVGIIMSIVTYRMEGKTYLKDVEEREKEYLEYIRMKEELLLEEQRKELEIRKLIYDSIENSVNEVMLFGKRVYEKDRADKDFLDIYLGLGEVISINKVKFNKQEFVDTQDPISMIPEELEEKYRILQNAPITSRFGHSCGVGVVGKKAYLFEILRNMTLDLSIRHFYKSVKMYYIIEKEDIEKIKWIRWMRHVQNEQLHTYNFMCDEESKNVLMDHLYAELSQRESIRGEENDCVFSTHCVVFVLDSSEINKHPISKFIEKSGAYGFTFVFFEEYEEFIPKGCTEIIRIEDEDTGNILLAENGNDITEFNYTRIHPGQAEEVALRLGAIYVDEVNLESAMTKNITLFELLNIFGVEDLDLKQAWNKSKVYETMSAPLGVKRKNEVVYLDISDKPNAHGPHGLVAGTTGSGKSEIIQTYILSMATKFHPYDVSFLIIDFKGGGMANQFKDLPHLLGAITNIDGREINRSLLSIKAELVKRQAYFAEAEVNHINDYIKLYKKGVVEHPMPHLIIVVDEFAELKAEFPDFMKELISAARIGRTLGVHLILATQKPAGVVDAQIWSNSKFKLCLKVQTKEDSNEVLKTPLAAEIVEPGRAYFQVGNNEIFELFQSAYSGAKVSSSNGNKVKLFDIYELNHWGKRTRVYTNKTKGNNEHALNELQSVVKYVRGFCEENQIEQLQGICLPSLPDILHRRDLADCESNAIGSIIVPVGIYDDPAQQIQEEYYVDASSNTYIVGSAMTGKTTLLHTILLQILNKYTPREVNAYIIDCGNMTLKVFEESNVVGGVAILSEEEKISNLFKLLLFSVEERKKKLAEKGLGTFAAYSEAGYCDMPQIILFIDNLAAFKEYYEDYNDDFLKLSREGSSLGISIIATASQTNAMNYRAVANYGTRITFVCNDKSEYTTVFGRCRIEPKEVVGRGLCMVDKKVLEFHTALCVEGEKEYIRVENTKKLIYEGNEKYPNIKAKKIPVVPELITYHSIRKDKELYPGKYMVPIGIKYSSVQYESIDLSTIGVLATMGREKVGKSNFVKYMLKVINDNIFTYLSEAYVVDGEERALEEVQSYGFVEQYTTSILELESYVSRIEEQLIARKEAVAADKYYSVKDLPLLLLVIENSEFNNLMLENKKLSAKLSELVKYYKKYKFMVLVSSIENNNIPFNGPEFLKFIKESHNILVFDHITTVKFVDINVKQQRDNVKPIEVGDAFMFMGNHVDRIKTIYKEE